MTEQGEIPGLGALYAALAKAQGAMTVADKDHKVGFDTKAGPSVKYSYATLAGVWESCRKPLSENGLAVIQLVQSVTGNAVTVNSILGHASGQSISSVLTLPVIGGTAQAVGSAITYARRYTLMALVGIVTDEDDDGQAASKSTSKPAPKPVNPIDAAQEIPYPSSPESQAKIDVKAVPPRPVNMMTTGLGFPREAPAQPPKANPRNVRMAELVRLGTEWYGENGIAFAMKNHVKKVYDHDSAAELTNAQIEEQITEFGRRIDARKADLAMQPGLAPFTDADEFSSGAEEHGKGVD